MPTVDLKTPFWDENGTLYRPGKDREVPESVARELQAKKGAGSSDSQAAGEDTLAGVEFASPEAEQLARESGLSASDFEGQGASGSSGGYTKADVQRIASEKEG